MKIVATSDVSSEPLDEFATQFADTYHGDPPELGRVALLSMDPPSWVRLIAELSWWQQALAASAALYVAELVKEAAKETWQSRAKVVAAAVKAATGVKTFAAAVWSLRARVPARTELLVCLPDPNEHFGVQLSLTAQDHAVAELEVALFVHHLPAVSRLLENHKVAGIRAVSGYFLELRVDGSLYVHWFDAKSMERNEQLISLAGEALPSFIDSPQLHKTDR